MTSDPRVVIVGAGASGLAAAWSLIRNGIRNVTILEAQDRIGGRIHTMDIGNVNIDMGASFVHGQGNNPVYTLAKKHDLLAKYKGGLFDINILFNFSDGQSADEKVVNNIMRNFFIRLFIKQTATKFGWKCDLNESFGDYALDYYEKSLVKASDTKEVKSIKSALLGLFHNLVKNENACDSWQQLSLVGVMEELSFGGDPYGGLRHGYQSLLDVLLRDIPGNCIKLSNPVSKISWRGSGVTVSTDKGTFEADHVIVSPSVGYLRQNKEDLFEPSLGEKKIEALENIGFGTLGKLFLEFDEQFWETKDTIWALSLLWKEEDELLELSDVAEDVEPWYRSLLAFLGVPQYPRVIMGLIGGHDGEVMESRPPQEVASVCHQLLKKFTGRQDIPPPKNVWTSSWHNSKYFLGSYSYVRVPTGPQIYDDLAEPLPSIQNPRLQFAGEATERSYHSTVQGALISGEREAQRLLALYGRTVDHSLWKKPSKWACTVM